MMVHYNKTHPGKNYASDHSSNQDQTSSKDNQIVEDNKSPESDAKDLLKPSTSIENTDVIIEKVDNEPIQESFENDVNQLAQVVADTESPNELVAELDNSEKKVQEKSFKCGRCDTTFISSKRKKNHEKHKRKALKHCKICKDVTIHSSVPVEEMFTKNTKINL